MPNKILWAATALIMMHSCVTAAWSESRTAPEKQPGRIVGNLDGVSQDGDQFFISGWACQQGQKKSIVVHVYVEDAKTPSKTKFALPAMADLYSEPAVAQACQDHEGGRHRFLIALPDGYGPESKFDVHGIRVVGEVPNEAISGSGVPLRRLPAPELFFSTLPPLSGSYQSLGEHPRVFTTAAELKDLIARINQPGSYSAQRFSLLTDQIKHDLASGIDWDVTYSGCNAWIYQYVFSYEPQDHHEAEIRSELQIAPGAKAPTGAAVVASRLALYAALMKGGAIAPSGAPSADQATAFAKRILLAWANHGFPRDSQGHFQSLQSISCRGGPELDLGRGVLYSVQAQDLLQSFGALTSTEESQLNAMHSALFDWLREGDNVFFAGIAFPYSECARYTNLAANAMASLLAIARLLDDGRKFDAVLHSGNRSIPVLRPWLKLFDRAIYGESDALPDCATHNRGPDSLTSLKNQWDFQTPNVAPGEIADRGRNASPGQGIGYPMFTLERLFDAAEILRIAGYDPYGYRGVHKQSIEMAMQYYACYAKGDGFYSIVSAENSGSCPDAVQYYGKLVNGVERMVLIGAYRFPRNSSITELEAQARTRSLSGPFSTDAILFGKWRD